MSRDKFLQHISSARNNNELVIDSPDEFEQNQDIFWNEIFKLVNIKKIEIINQHIDALPSDIGVLEKLEELSIVDDPTSENIQRLSVIPDSVFHLPQLTRLEIVGQNIRKISPHIKNLTALQVLILGNVLLFDMYGEIGDIAGETRIPELPLEFFELVDLRVLDLGGIGLSKIPRQIGVLKNLTSLSARANNIIDIPKEIRLLRRLKHLDLRNNPIDIPPEILERVKSPKALLSSFFAVRRPLNQLKILFVGQGSVGKTSLVRTMVYGSFDPNQTKTDGISVNQWQVDIRQSGKRATPIELNLWDFGGQEIMHATHQFFLTKRSLYLLVLDSRLTQEENRIEYWLKIIQSFGGESPVLIIGNKIDQHPLDIDRTGLQKKYPSIVGFLETSAATGAGIEELKTAITEQVNNLPHVRDLLPETWFTVKTELEELGQEKNFITHDKYLELCSQNEVSDDTSQRTLIGFLHDLGVVLHFQDDLRLESLGILNPQWVTNGVYKILNSHELFINKGVLTLGMLNEILNIDGYPRDKRLFMVDMMKKFELCYNLEPDKSFLVPDLLPKDQPELEFDGIPAFEYAYPVLPSSVITRFIVRMNQKIDDDIVWRTGVLLKIGDNRALVKADLEDRKINISIDGLEHTRRDALSAIRYQLDEIHASIKGLDAQKRVPVPNVPNAEALEYDYLLMLEREGQETHLVKDGARLVRVNVREILSGIESEAQRRETGGNVTNIYVGGNLDGSLTVGNDNVVIRDSYNKITSAKIDPELKETLKLLTEAVAAMNKELPEAQADEAAEDLGRLVDEATKPKSNQRWYSVSIDGLIQAAENLDKLGEPVISLSRKVLSLLTGGVVK